MVQSAGNHDLDDDVIFSAREAVYPFPPKNASSPTARSSSPTSTGEQKEEARRASRLASALKRAFRASARGRRD